jgi:K+-transporting ATPase ATPase C chain
MLTSSASGLDPHISTKAAYFQAARIANARHVKIIAIINLINQHAYHSADWDFWNYPVVNVLEINLLLDQLFKDKK